MLSGLSLPPSDYNLDIIYYLKLKLLACSVCRTIIRGSLISYLTIMHKDILLERRKDLILKHKGNEIRNNNLPLPNEGGLNVRLPTSDPLVPRVTIFRDGLTYRNY